MNYINKDDGLYHAFKIIPKEYMSTRTKYTRLYFRDNKFDWFLSFIMATIRNE
jgi:hypothetical protein